MLEQTEPDIIIASETWLHQGILERGVLPENYRFVARRDRLKSDHGGVAVIAKSDLEGVEVDTPSDTEFVAASFTCKEATNCRFIVQTARKYPKICGRSL